MTISRAHDAAARSRGSAESTCRIVTARAVRSSISLAGVIEILRDLLPELRTVREPAAQGVDEGLVALGGLGARSEEHTSELQSLMRISYAVFCLKKKNE